jgi:hypothetical protein
MKATSIRLAAVYEVRCTIPAVILNLLCAGFMWRFSSACSCGEWHTTSSSRESARVRSGHTHSKLRWLPFTAFRSTCIRFTHAGTLPEP